MKRTLKILLMGYQKIWFYTGFAISELRKPLQLWNETVAILTLLGVYGIFFKIGQVSMFYVIIMTILLILGIIFIRLGMMRINNSLAFKQNKELNRIEEKIHIFFV